MGSSDLASGWPETRLCQRPRAKPRPGPAGRGAAPVAESGNMMPPGRSKFPVRMASTSTSQLVRVPNSTVVEPIRRRHRLGREVRRQPLDLVDAGKVPGPLPHVDEALLEEHPHHREEQQGVGAGPDREMLVGQLRGTGAPGVDDGEPPAAAAQRPDPAREVGCGAQAPVGVQWVGADDQEVVGAVQVRYGDGQRIAVEQPAGDMLGHLVDGGGGEDAAGAEGGEQDGRVEGAGDGVHIGVAEHHGDGGTGRFARTRELGGVAVRLDQRAQPGLDGGERLVPGGLRQRSVAAHQGAGEPVGVGVQLTEGRAFGADEALAEDVVPVAADRGHPVTVHGDAEPASGLTERADAQGGTGHRSLPGTVPAAELRTVRPYRPVGMRAALRRKSARGSPSHRRYPPGTHPSPAPGPSR